MTIGINSRKKVVVLGVVWLVAGSLLYIDLSEHSSVRPILAVRSEERIDETIADPKLRIGLLATLQTVKVLGDGRDLFQFVATEANKAVQTERRIVPNPTTQPIKPPDVQQPPPTPFRFYGYTSIVKQWPKRAFFLEGDAIYIAVESDLIKSRYKVIYVGVNSAVVEDTSNKSQQALPLVDSI